MGNGAQQHPQGTELLPASYSPAARQAEGFCLFSSRRPAEGNSSLHHVINLQSRGMRQKTGMQTGPSEGVERFTPGPGGHHTLLAHRVSINQLAELGTTPKAQFLLFHPISAFPPQERASASPGQHRQL